MLDQPVLQRVKGEDAETSPGFEQSAGGAEARVELVQLVVHENAQRLESLSGDVCGSVESVFPCIGDGSRE